MHQVSKYTVYMFPSIDESKQQSTCSSYITALEEPPGTVILLKHKPRDKKYWEPLHENSRRAEKRVKTHLAFLCLLTWKKRQWKQCSPVIHALGFRGELQSWASLTSPTPCQPDCFSWAVRTPCHYVLGLLNGHLNSDSSIENNGYVAKLPASTLFSTSRFSRLSSLFVPCATQKWFNTREGLINQWLAGNWAFLEDFCTVPKG